MAQNVETFNTDEYAKQLQLESKEKETCIFSTSFSDNGDLLAAGSNFGTIALFKIADILVSGFMCL